MFHSNQRFEFSGDLTEKESLKDAIQFAFKVTENLNLFEDKEYQRGCRLLYQITEDGKYCLGWDFNKASEGWSEFPRFSDIDTVSKTVENYLKTFKADDFDSDDGISNKGFLMKIVKESEDDEDVGIKNCDDCIVYFEPYTCYYSK